MLQDGQSTPPSGGVASQRLLTKLFVASDIVVLLVVADLPVMAVRFSVS
jgi:hypothetical protein